MSNVLTGAQIAAVGRAAILPLRKKLLPLSAFSTDISPVGSYRGATVAVPLLNAISANTTSSGYKAALTDFNSTAATVTLTHKVAGFALTEQQIATLPQGWETMSGGLVGVAAAEAGRAIADEVVDAGFALITSGNFTQSYAKAAADADSDDIMAARKVLVDLGGTPKSLVCNTGLYAEIVGLNVILDKSEVATTGNVPQVFGMDFHEAPTLISTGYLLGAIIDPRAIAVAVRPAAVGTAVTQDLLADEIVADPETGLALRYTSWVDRDTRSLCFAWEACYGAAVGVANALVRWTSQ